MHAFHLHCTEKPVTTVSAHKRCDKLGERGIALVSAILFIMVLAFVAATVLALSTTELKIASNHKSGTQAFYNAEAGASYVVGMIRNRFGDLDLGIGSNSATAIEFHYPAPANTDFPLLSFNTWTTARLFPKTTPRETDYRFQTIGNAANASSTVEVSIRIPVIPKGIFGNYSVSFKNNLTLENGPIIGSNGPVYSKNGGDKLNVLLGPTGEASDETGKGNKNKFGEVLKVSTVIQQDPLNAHLLVSQHQAHNDNAVSDIGSLKDSNLLSGIIDIKPGRYYVTSMPTINSFIIKDVIPPNDTVVIYYHGASATEQIKIPASAVNNTPMSPKKLVIISDTANEIYFPNDGTYNMFIYAPFAKVTFENKATFEGIIWSKSLEAKNNFTFKYNKDLAPFLAPPITQLRWKML